MRAAGLDGPVSAVAGAACGGGSGSAFSPLPSPARPRAEALLPASGPAVPSPTAGTSRPQRARSARPDPDRCNSGFVKLAVARGATAFRMVRLVHQAWPLDWRRSPIHLKADREGMKKYSPPPGTLNVWMPWMRRRTGCCGMVNVAPSSCSPTFGSRSSPRSMKLPLLIHSWLKWIHSVDQATAVRVARRALQDAADDYLGFPNPRRHVRHVW